MVFQSYLANSSNVYRTLDQNADASEVPFAVVVVVVSSSVSQIGVSK